MTETEQEQWIEFDAPWLFEPGVVRVLKKPATPTRDELLSRVYRNEMAQPYIVETEFERRLHFTRDATQSTMLLRDPDALVARYTRKMMAFLLFTPSPRRILMIGMGGGSLAKFCYRHLPDADITVVEINEDVISLRNEFHIPKDSARFRVIQADGARYIETLRHRVDAILVDAFDPLGIAESLASSPFYFHAARRLSQHGALVMNLWGQKTRFVDNLREARCAFDKHIRLVPVAYEDNVLLFGSKLPAPTSIGEELALRARRLQARLSLEFPDYLRRICQGHTTFAH